MPEKESKNIIVIEVKQGYIYLLRIGAERIKELSTT